MDLEVLIYHYKEGKITIYFASETVVMLLYLCRFYVEFKYVFWKETVSEESAMTNGCVCVSERGGNKERTPLIRYFKFVPSFSTLQSITHMIMINQLV